ncbi:hypothetical protein C5167_004735 [Papaver somniferum]|uniref:Uncharacterized protein n=1 Tax=Papaver somniferum TaxID=3469 RepID=A0A4Y7JCG5_PAPSO|nr:hypothetical protein C5167_004735 [Papaver somniferum]
MANQGGNLKSTSINGCITYYIAGQRSDELCDYLSRMLRLQNKSSVCRINSAEHAGDTNQEVTAPQFLDKMAVGTSDGKVHQMAVGTSDGKVLVYDLGSSHPTRVEDHMRVILWYAPMTLNSEGTKLITTDSHIVRIWDPERGDNITSIEPTGGTINDALIFDKSGL